MSAFVILLTVVLVMPEGKEDLQETRRVETLAECWSAAQAWMEQDAHKAGGIGLAASCQRVEAPGEDG